MTEGRTGVDAPDTEVERTATTSEGTAGSTPEHTPETTSEPTDAGRTDAADVTTAGVGTAEPQPGDTVPAATVPGDEPADARHGAPEAEDENSWADAEDQAYQRELRKGLAFGLAGGLVVGAIVALLLGAFVYPGYLGGPGSPDDTANRVVSALAAKDAPGLEQVSCKAPDGSSVAQLSPQVLQLIGAVRPSGPTTQVIDTEARTPVDLTLSYQGQTQTLPSEIVLGQSQGSWCLKGLAQRQ